jgi:hypothetical protein
MTATTGVAAHGKLVAASSHRRREGAFMAYDIFMSYTHIKDFNGAVTGFLDHIEPELYMKSGKIISVFRDRRDIEPGDEWEPFLSEQLKSAKMLLILLSPTWLTSKYCKREYEEFRDSMVQLPTKRIVPLLWDVLDHATLDASQTALLSEVEKYERIDWGLHRYDDFTTTTQRAAVGALAEKLVDRLNQSQA